uniref:Ninein n=1 Tax=Lygus hesperus TaxID=30085 RepID=A0A0K8T5W9_LYGHE
MKVSEWEKIVLVWVNALKLTDDQISDISELHKSDFFLNLIACLGKPVNREEIEDEGAILTEVKSILEEEFKGFTVVDGLWDNYETTLVTSLLLLLSAFKCHDLRTPLYSLCGETQLVIQSFIQKFISIHKFTPLEQISRQLLITSLTDLCTDDDDCPSEAECSEIESSPPKRLLSPLKNMNSPELQRHGQAKVKSLECQLELLSWDKQHLVEEVDILKADLSDLRSKYEGNASQVLKLENELFLAKNSGYRLDGEAASSKISDPSTEIKLLKSDLDTLSHRLSVSTSDLDREQLKNAELTAKLKRAEQENIFLTEKCADCDLKILALQANVEDLEGVISSLKSTVKDQAELLSDSSFIAMSPNPRDMSLNESAIAGETMASVVEIKYCELEDELDNIKEALRLSEEKVSELEKQLESKTSEADMFRNKVKEHEVEDWEKISRLQSELAEKTADMEELREDNEFLTRSLGEKRKDMERLQSDYNRLKRKEEEVVEELSILQGVRERECACERQRLTTSERISSVNEELVHEIAHLGQLLEGKQVRLEEANVLLEKIKRDLSDRDNEKDGLVSENRSLKTKLSAAQAKMADLVNALAELVDCSSPSPSPFVLVNKIACHISTMSSRIDELTLLKEKYEDELAGLKKEAVSRLKTTEKASDDAYNLHEKMRALESEYESLNVQHRVRGTELLALQQTVSMCEHEKAILQRRIDLLTIEADKCESMKNEIARLKSFVNNLEMELSTEKIEHKRLRDQVEMNEKLSVAFDTKLSSLQAELKSQYDKDMSRAVDEYNEKINQMKRRMQRDKNHIKELSNELWETSDRYLLASQEADALRNQLRRTRTALELVACSKTPQKENIVPQSNPCLWSENKDLEDTFDERVTVTRERWSRRHSGGGHSIWSELSRYAPEGEDEMFGDGFLEDLKAGVVRLPQQPATLASRASCPPPIKGNDSGNGGERVFANDKQSLLPPENPKEKDRWHIVVQDHQPPVGTLDYLCRV